jgi:heme A synthase
VSRSLAHAWRFASGSPSKEVDVNWNTWIRQTHRWLSIAFTVAVIVTSIALAQENPVVWVSYVPLLPLALLLFTGLYLFVLPYATRWRGGPRATTLRE